MVMMLTIDSKFPSQFLRVDREHGASAQVDHPLHDASIIRLRARHRHQDHFFSA
jgi:hypothetical protein